MTRSIASIEEDLRLARQAYAYSGPTHVATERCERLYAELLKAKRREGMGG